MWKRKHGSEHRNGTYNYEREAEKDDSEHRKQEDMVALNAKLKNDQGL